ncbi:type IV pili methyl-accepting chemotaxis transducer N-terminal domain-containing protein [Polaribacter sp. R77954]|uniref:type IV pili methyl-accepting chemotaxis transducer N-terminal domain-containing protein n=1 Tax=Polaribacter sp. R77954 TaxID=3093870 RepID=UPI0037C5B254
MKNRSIFIFTTFIVLLTINKISLHRDIKRQSRDLSAVNISGRQRMFSQKILKLALLLKENTTKQNTLKNSAKLKAITENFKKLQQELKENYLTKYDDFYLKGLYKELEPFYLAIVTNSNLLTSNNINKKEIISCFLEISKASDHFLRIMDKIVNQHELIGKNRGKLILRREFTFNVIIGCLSIYGIFFVVVPMFHLINQTK